MIPSRKIFMMLGRYGDVMNMLPLVWHEHQIGNNPIVCIAAEFEKILDGVSYCERIVFPGLYNDPPAALRWIKANRPRDQIIICQAYRHPFDQQKVTPSWQTESWRVAGALEHFGRYPLVFDKRYWADEQKLIEAVDTEGRPMILVSADSVSSPFPARATMIAEIQVAFPEHDVVDLSTVRTDHVFNLIGLFNQAACLVTIDTMHLHLSRAAQCPVVAIVNDGFFGSVPPPAAHTTIRYADCAKSFSGVISAISRIIRAKKAHRFVIHACDLHGDTPRHHAAQRTWDAAGGEESVTNCHTIANGKPKLRTILEAALDVCGFDDDVIVWSNSDVGFTEDAFRHFREHAGMWGAASMRRFEPGPQTKVHVGREVFAFRADWLSDHLEAIPDFYIAAPGFDLILAAMIRKERGILTTIENLAIDFWPCDMTDRYAIHQQHLSGWAGKDELTRPENIHNLRLAREWAAANMPTLKL